MTDSLPTVLIWRNDLLPWSETFIQNQATALVRYRPVWAGMRRRHDLAIDPAQPCWLPKEEKLRLPLVIRAVGYRPSIELINWCRSQSVRIIHAHFGPDGCAALPLARSLGVPLVVTFHGFDACIPAFSPLFRIPFMLWPYMIQRRSLIHGATRLICVSEFIRQAVIKQGFTPSSTVTCHIGVPPTDDHGVYPGTREPVLLFVGRLVTKKGLPTLLHALALLPAGRPPLIVIGDGPLLQSTQNIAKRLSLDVRFLGKRSPAEVRGWMRTVQAIVVPSQIALNGDCEGLPTVIKEAMLDGAPIIATRHAGIPEAITDGESGLLVNEKDSNGLAAAITRMASDGALREKLSANAKKLANVKFNMMTCTAQLEAIYDEAIAVGPIR